MNIRLKQILTMAILLMVLAGFFVFRVKIKNLFSQVLQSAGLAGIGLWPRLNMTKENIPATIEFEVNKQNMENGQDFGSEKNATEVKNQPEESNAQTNSLNRLPAALNLNVPFTSQAPNANWDATFKEACEEAAVLMVDKYYQNQSFASPEQTEAEILKMIDWQKDYFGGHFDLTVEQTVEMIKNYLNYENVEIIDNPTIEQIKDYLNQKKPVLMPAAGQLLNNPYFRSPGPVYHMLVIKGYTETKFITNDPGTKNGKDFLYDYQTLMDALHDWNNGADIQQGAKRVMVISP